MLHALRQAVWDALRDNDNFKILTVCKRQSEWKRGGFLDVHLDRKAAMQWLGSEANQYKGRTQR